MATSATTRQEEILKAILTLSKEKGFPPTLQELSASVGATSKGGAASGVQALVKKGLLTITPRIARSMVLTPAGLSQAQ